LTLFNNKYRIESARLKHWNYSNPGIYFITICTYLRQSFLGEIENAKMKLNRQGELAIKIWYKITGNFENVILDEFVIMPNHVHGIIIITKNDNEGTVAIHRDSLPPNDKHKDVIEGRDTINRVSTGGGGITG